MNKNPCQQKTSRRNKPTRFFRRDYLYKKEMRIDSLFKIYLQFKNVLVLKMFLMVLSILFYAVNCFILVNQGYFNVGCYPV